MLITLMIIWVKTCPETSHQFLASSFYWILGVQCRLLETFLNVLLSAASYVSFSLSAGLELCNHHSLQIRGSRATRSFVGVACVPQTASDL